jgi:pimeloyl-ACP methyl ester carboxylesterase
MIDADTIVAAQRNALRVATAAWSAAHDQALTLGRLALHHGDAIATSQMRAAGATAMALAGLMPQLAAATGGEAISAYVEDSAQRLTLFVETLCRRGDACLARETESFRPVLAFDYDVIIDGRTLERAANYALVRIHPLPGMPAPREDGRPWVIIDPRAGHGSGIGGFKSESEVGVALKGGHPVYFVIFYPDPVPGQTLADVCAAEATFLAEVRRRHPRAPKPLVTGNCQGGWAAMILAATHPDLTGPLVIAGAPLSYWAGERGRNPFRYFGGIAGGALPAVISSDLGGGTFDGANLVMNFEQLNPGKTLFRKNYDLYADVDREAERFLDFERWWSRYYIMNASEIRWIVETLFVGNKLTRGEAHLSDGTPVDLTRIAAPIIVFASHGDNITPPQQALNWIADLYSSEEELRAGGHVIIYTLHDSIGHLGIFVSAQVANVQHEQIGSVIKTIESLAPGLYEMKIASSDGQRQVSFEGRTMADMLKLDDGRDDEEEFAAVAALSEWLTRTYEITARPLVRAVVTPEIAELTRAMHPMRLQQSFFSHRNPLFADLAAQADKVRGRRVPVAADNVFVALERVLADGVERGFDLARDTRDAAIEMTFYALYGTPWMRRLGAAQKRPPVSHDLARIAHVREVVGKAAVGGYAEGIIRMLILLARTRGSVRRDRLERSDALLHSRAPFNSMTPEVRTRMIYEQSLIVEFAGEAAVTTLADILKDPVDRYRSLNFVLDIAGPIAEMDPATLAMYKRFQRVLMTMAHDWRDPELERTPEAAAPGTGVVAPAIAPPHPAGDGTTETAA